MGAAAFDTLAAAREIEKAGLDRTAAEAIAGAIRSGQGDLATRADLEALAQTTKTDLAALESRMDTRFVELRGEMARCGAKRAPNCAG